jgi:Raf kinase inhibitor-like YbhB/YbcL family protein
MQGLGRRALAVGIGLLVGAALAACSSSASPEVSGTVSNLKLSSPAFADGGAIPSQYTCDGADRSPPLTWSGVPDGVEAFALIVEDPDAAGFIHWVLSDIPGDLRELPEDQGDAIGAPGRTSFGDVGWGGPCPPTGEHRYVFTLSALSAQLRLGATPSASEVRAAVSGVLLGQASLTGLYRRAG